MISDKSRTMADAEYEKQMDLSAGKPIRKGDYLRRHYRVETDAIQGGMGSVWHIHHTLYDADMAMKRPKPKYFTTPKQRMDFIRECEAWISLGLHPNIVACYFVDEIYGIPSVFSEWMDSSLRNIMTDGTLYEGTSKEQEKRLLDIAIQSAEGLDYAHEHKDRNGNPAGLIHQDVKPDNLLLTSNYEVRISDFGLSKAYAILATAIGKNHDAAEADGDLTILSPAGGYTLAYGSPEQMDSRPLTRRTDIYSWAVSMMEIYIGSRPWETGVVAGLRCSEYMKHTRVRMSLCLKELLVRCMKKDVAERPHDFREIIDRLRQIYEEDFSEPYFRTRPEITKSAGYNVKEQPASSVAVNKAQEIYPGLILGGMDEPWSVPDMKPDVLVPLEGMPASFWERGYNGEIVYYREAIRLKDMFHYLPDGRHTVSDYPAAEYPAIPRDMLERLTNDVLQPLRDGKRVAIFCADGCDRTAYIAACVLFQLGIENPVSFLRERYSPSAVKNPEQEKTVEFFCFMHVAQTHWHCVPLIRKVRVKDMPIAVVEDPDIVAARDQIDKELGEHARILVRPWGVVPEISILVEAPDEAQCECAIEAYIDALKKKGYFEEVVR